MCSAVCFASRLLKRTQTKRLMPKQNSVAFEPFGWFMPCRQWEPVWCGTAANNCTLSHYHKFTLEGPKNRSGTNPRADVYFWHCLHWASVVSHSCCREIGRREKTTEVDDDDDSELQKKLSAALRSRILPKGQAGWTLALRRGRGNK